MNMRLVQPLMGFAFALCSFLATASDANAQTSTGTAPPVVTIVATDPSASWTGNPGTFTVFRSGDPTPALNVYCCISGTASNGVDYASIGSFVSLPSGVISNSVVINPINRGQTNIETVVLELCPSPLMTPVNYQIGYPSQATVYIAPATVSNLPPVVNIVNPTNGAIYKSPANISLFARASDPDGTVTNVEFFAGAKDLGRGLPVILDPPGVNGAVGLLYLLNWTNIPAGPYSLTAVATDNGGATTVSPPVNITVTGTVSNLPPVVNIVNPTNGAVYQAPANISLIARASDPDGTVTNVEFFAGATDLGRALPVVLDPPGVNGVVGLVYFLNWENIPQGAYSLTAVATDNTGASTISSQVNITVRGPASNAPPIVRITSPPNAAVFRAPINLPIFAYAADPDGIVASVEFFADGSSLGFGHPVAAVPPPVPAGSVQPPIMIVRPTNYWEFDWTNAPVGTNIALTVTATDNAGATATSAPPVFISILPPVPPPTNRPALVRIVATDPIAIEGTNCWPWLALANATPPAWSNWVAPTAVFRLITNCGPKNATFTVFRVGTTNEGLAVDYAIGGTATNGTDYAALPGTVVIPAGNNESTISIVPLDDGPPDINSTVILRITPDTNYIVGIPSAAAAIILDSHSPRAITGLLPGQLFHLTSTGPDGAWFHVEYSTDLMLWTPLCTNQVINGSVDFIDPDAPNQPTRYYRAVPEPGTPAQ